MARRWAVVAVGLVGCSAFKSAPPVEVAQPAAGATPSLALGVRPDTRRTPSASEGVATQTVQPKPPSELPTEEKADPQPAADALTLAAESLRLGDRVAAAKHLDVYVRDHPEQLMFRAQLAE